MSNLKIFINKFKETNFDYFLLNSSDEFLNEYISESEMKLKWLTNFSGSNGLALIGKNKNYFFTDGRYTLQAKKEIDHSFKIIETSEQNFMDFAKQNLFDKKILLDLKTFDYQFIIRLKAIILSKSGIISHDRNELINFLWKDRPTKIKHQIFKLSTIFCGRTVKQKIKDLVFKSNFQTFILTSPDSINWLFNIRGYDLEHSPIAFTRAIITKDKIFIFIDLKKVSKKLFKSTKYLNFISILKFESYLKKLKKNDKIFLDSNVSYYYYQILKKYNTNLTIGIDPCKIMKSKKNEAEIKCSKRAHLNDGISLTKFFYWLSNQTFDYKLTEYSVAQKLETFRKENSDFFSISFPTISATGSNGSIIHYKPDSKRCLKLKKGDLFLCDSGGQYTGATTDVTRTIFMGAVKPKREFVNMYTRVLIGHLNIGMLKFPKGTKGYQIDVLARCNLWEEGVDFNHGTGHGVGSFLNVHEGPQSISKKYTDVDLQEGMIVSNEPGFYKNGVYGIRIENLVLVKNSIKIKNFLEFETLTLFPYEESLIDKEMLNKKQKLWINNYHDKIYKLISPYLNLKERKWLRKKAFKFN